MANAAQLNLKLGIDVSSLSRELGKLESRMSKFGSQMQNIGSTMTQSLTLPLLGVGAASLKAFSDMEKLEKGLTAIMGSSELAKDEIVKLREVAKLPGLGLKEAVQGSVNLQAVGLSAEEAKNTLMGFGTALAATGKGKVELEAIQYQLTQMISKNKLLAEDYKVIQSNLPLMAKGLEAAFGTSNIEKIRETGISAKEFALRLAEGLSILPETQNVTGGLANSFENLSDNIFIALSDFGNTINKSLELEKVFTKVSDKLYAFVEGFKRLKPEVQSFIVYFALTIAAMGPAIFIIGKLISTYGALAGISKKVVDAFKDIRKAITYLASNPQLLIITAAVAALGAVALYVYDNWKAFQDRFKNIWINIKNSIGEYIAIVLGKVDKLQKALGLNLFNLKGLTTYQKEQRIVATEFKTIGETVDSLKGKLGSLFMVDAKSKGKGSGIIDDKKTDNTDNTPNADAKIDKKLFAFDSFKTLNELQKAKEELDKAVLTDVAPKLREQLGITEGGLISMKNAANDVLALGERLKNNPPEMAKPFSDADAAAFKLEERVNRLADSFEILNVGLQNIVDGTLNDLAIGFGDELGKALSGAGFSISSLITPMADALAQFGKLAIQTGITAAGIKLALKPPINPALAIAGGVALVALSKLVKSKVPALAEGGLATGPTMALVGDNRNARVDPEVIAPLSKLKGMLDGGGSPYILTTRVAGSDLLVIMEKARNINSRIR
jgi:tape measure domain-containing protein